MSYRTVEIGLPFYNDINKQTRKKVYFGGYSAEWLTELNRLPPFQFYKESISAISAFTLVNVDTGATTDLSSYFSSNVETETEGLKTYYLHWGNTDISLSNGRYYLYATDGITQWYSEVFVPCIGSVTPSKLLINDTDYLLINATDNLLIN